MLQVINGCYSPTYSERDQLVLSEELAEKMSTTGIEVEGVSSPAEGLSKIVVGEVVRREDGRKHRPHVRQVNVGEEALRQIVRKAPQIYVLGIVAAAFSRSRIATIIRLKRKNEV